MKTLRPSWRSTVCPLNPRALPGRRTWCGWCCRSPNSDNRTTGGILSGRKRRRPLSLFPQPANSAGTGRCNCAGWTPGPCRPPLFPDSTNLAGTGRRDCARQFPGLYRPHRTPGADSGSAVHATGATLAGIRMADGWCGSPAEAEASTRRLVPHRDPRRDKAMTGNRGERVGVGMVCLKCGVKRSNRGFLLAITGIIASKVEFHASHRHPTQSKP